MQSMTLPGCLSRWSRCRPTSRWKLLRPEALAASIFVLAIGGLTLWRKPGLGSIPTALFAALARLGWMPSFVRLFRGLVAAWPCLWTQPCCRPDHRPASMVAFATFGGISSHRSMVRSGVVGAFGWLVAGRSRVPASSDPPFPTTCVRSRVELFAPSVGLTASVGPSS
jgi:hypothetical protein